MPPSGRARARLEAVLDDVLGQVADLGRQRIVEPVLRQGLRLLGGVRRSGEGQRRAGPAPGRRVARRRGHLEQRQVSAAANNGQRNPPDGCTIRTDSRGPPICSASERCRRRGRTRSSSCRRPRTAAATLVKRTPVAGPVTEPGLFDPVLGRPTIDGIAGARSDLAPAPSVDIAKRRTEWRRRDESHRHDVRQRRHHRAARVLHRVDRRRGTWSAPRAIETSGDRAFIRHRRSRRTGRTSTSSTTRSRIRIGRTRPSRGSS